MDDAIAALKAAGAIVVDVDIPSISRPIPKENLLTAGQSSVLNYGMKRDFNAWLASLGPAAPVKSLTELREWNTAHERMGAIKYGQSQLDASDKIDLEKDRAKYEADRARDIRVGGTHGIDAAMKANKLDALLFPGPTSAGIASKPGYPTVLVPFGMVPNTPGNFGGADGRPRRGAPAAGGAAPRHPLGAAPPEPGPAAGLRSEAAAVRRRVHRQARAASRRCCGWPTPSSRRRRSARRRRDALGPSGARCSVLGAVWSGPAGPVRRGGGGPGYWRT